MPFELKSHSCNRNTKWIRFSWDTLSLSLYCQPRAQGGPHKYTSPLELLQVNNILLLGITYSVRDYFQNQVILYDVHYKWNGFTYSIICTRMERLSRVELITYNCQHNGNFARVKLIG